MYYIKVEIKTPEDLPTKDGKYTVCSVDGREYEKEFKINSLAFKKSWEQWIKWYYQPIELSFPTEDEIKADRDEYSEVFKYKDHNWTHIANAFMSGAKCMLAEIKKRNGL